jgi:hypothetical protein
VASRDVLCLDNIREELDRSGFLRVPEVVSPDVIGKLRSELGQLSVGRSTRRESFYAARNLIASVPAIAALASSQCVRSLIEPVLGSDSFPVRGLLFDKVPGANWHVGWHQGQIIPVAEKRDVPGFTAWSVKHGVPHVRPPTVVLEDMLTLRLHLDDCDDDNGALRVIPGSHCDGFLSAERIRELTARETPVVCDAQVGDVLVMRPLLLHGSSPARLPSHRRVVHLEFATEPLPHGLVWPRFD